MKKAFTIAWFILTGFGIWLTWYAQSVGRIPSPDTSIVIYYLITIGTTTAILGIGFIVASREAKSKRITDLEKNNERDKV